MGRLFIRKEAYDGCESKSEHSLKSIIINAKKPKIHRNRRYCDNYLKFGFSWCRDVANPIPLCVVCGKKLSNESMVPSKLKRHFTTKHPFLQDKDLSFFQRLLEQQSKQPNVFQKTMTLSEHAQRASIEKAVEGSSHAPEWLDEESRSPSADCSDAEQEDQKLFNTPNTTSGISNLEIVGTGYEADGQRNTSITGSLCILISLNIPFIHQEHLELLRKAAATPKFAGDLTISSGAKDSYVEHRSFNYVTLKLQDELTRVELGDHLLAKGWHMSGFGVMGDRIVERWTSAIGCRDS